MARQQRLELDCYDRLIGSTYEATLEPASWQKFLNHLATAVGGYAAMLRVQHLESNRLGLRLHTQGNEDFFQLYEQHYSMIDPIIPAVAKHPVGTVLMIRDVLLFDNLKQTEFYNDYMQPQDQRYIMGGFIAREEDVVATLGVHRNQHQGDFDEKHRYLLQRLMPHLNRAMRINRLLDSLRDEKEALSYLVNSLALSIFLLDEQCKPIWMNQSAEKIVHSGQTLKLGKHGLTACCPRNNGKLRSMIVATYQDNNAIPKSCEISQSMAGGRPWRLVTVRYEHAHALWPVDAPEASVALFICDPDASNDLPTRILARCYRLTPAESRLLEVLGLGSTLNDYTERYGVTKNTARSQLKALFAKVGVNRQAQLVQLYSAIPIGTSEAVQRAVI